MRGFERFHNHRSAASRARYFAVWLDLWIRLAVWLPRQEYWREVEGFPPYQVSNLGRVRNGETGAVLAPNLNSYRKRYQYRRVALMTGEAGDRHPVRFYVHRLVAKAWVEGETPKRRIVDHKDEDPDNNRALNLKWVSYRENRLLQIKRQRLRNRFEFARGVPGVPF